MRTFITLFTIAFWLSVPTLARAENYLLVPDAVFDGLGQDLHQGWGVLVEGGVITAAGPLKDIPATSARRIDLPGATLLPGLIDAHSHILLHPYNETPWNDQVLKESRAERVVRATRHLERSLFAGFTTLRDLGTEGAGYADVGLRTALEKHLIPGPRLLVAGRAIVATGSYAPKGFAPHVKVPLGAEPADGADLVRIVRSQIGMGIDWVKVYADYRWGPDGEARPTFSLDELRTIVRVAADSGRPTVAHAATAEGMRRATLAGVETIEHGDGGTLEVFRLMAKEGVAWCPTLGAGEAIEFFGGWVKGSDDPPARIVSKKATFKLALKAGVTICTGSDVGVFPHGDSAWELELMVEYGMTPAEVLISATSVNARLLHLEDSVGAVKKGLRADLVAVKGNPLEDISALRNVVFVMQEGRPVRQPE